VNTARSAFAYFVAALGGCALVGGISTMEPAWIAQAQKADFQRQQDLGAIADAIVFFKNARQDFPYDLSKLAENSRPSTAPLPLTDPESGRPYEYARIDSHRYKLCANFKLETLPTPPPVHDQTPVRGSVSPWAHSAGPHCFVFDGQSPTPLPSPMPDEARTQARRCGKARG
jgi:hypothetical protein